VIAPWPPAPSPTTTRRPRGSNESGPTRPDAARDSRRILAELESLLRERGYTALILATGPNQPEAVALYLATDWTPQYDLTTAPDERSFTKAL
jgi:hypothetical protein